MWDKLDALERRFSELNELMSRPEILTKAAEYQRFARERAELAKIVDAYQRFKRVIQEKDGVQHLLDEADGDAEMSQLGREELAQLAEQEAKLTYELKTLLLPADADDQKNVIIEIRAGTGGRRLHCSRQISSACTPNMRSARAGVWRSWIATPPVSVASKKSSPRWKVEAFTGGSNTRAARTACNVCR